MNREEFNKVKKKEFVSFLSSTTGLLDLPKELDIQVISLQLNTFRKMYHDFCVLMLSKFLSVNSFTILDWPESFVLQPDLYVMTKDSDVLILEVTLSLSKEIMEEKKIKYLNLNIEQIIISPLEVFDNLSNEIDLTVYLDFFENICSDFFFKINSFRETLKEVNLNINDINVFNEIFEYKPTRSKITWPKSVKKNERKEFELDVENVELLSQNIKLLMSDKDVSNFLDLRHTNQVSFAVLQNDVLKKISDDFVDSSDVKITHLFYPGNIREQIVFKEGTDLISSEFPEQRLLLKQLTHMVEDYVDFPMCDLLKQFRESLLVDKEARQIFSSGTISEELTEPELREEYKKSLSYRKISFLDFQRDREMSNTFGRLKEL